MMSKRIMGKASFAHLRDQKGDIQIFVKRDLLGDEPYAAFKKLDIGDIIGVKGEVFRTKMGEISVRIIRADAALQEPAAPAREVPRSDRPRGPLPSALC